jgi:hypothetical protein
MSEQYWKDRADALERAVRSALDAWEADEFDEAKYYEIRAALAQPEPDQPAQGGGRMEAEGRRGMDRREQVKCVAQLAEVSAKVYSMGHHQDCAMSGDSGSFCDCGYEIAKKIAESEKYGTVDELVGPNAEINEVCKYADQPADAGEPSTDQERFERVWQQLAYSLADFFALEATDAQARSIAREVLQAADAGEADEWECSMCGETMAREATWGDCGHEHCPMLPSEMEADAAIRRTGDTGGGDE